MFVFCMLEYMDERIVWILVAGALVGAWFNSCGKYLLSFEIWTVTNALLCISNLKQKNYAQAFLFLAYFFTSVNGWYNLQKQPTTRKNKKGTQNDKIKKQKKGTRQKD